jgi:phenylacetate-coenzyme A ligase PaaK-like adenylate-forming protein
MDAIETTSADKLRAVQETRLRTTLRHAYNSRRAELVLTPTG